jgi:hypothetical protein
MAGRCTESSTRAENEETEAKRKQQVEWTSVVKEAKFLRGP